MRESQPGTPRTPCTDTARRTHALLGRRGLCLVSALIFPHEARQIPSILTSSPCSTRALFISTQNTCSHVFFHIPRPCTLMLAALSKPTPTRIPHSRPPLLSSLPRQRHPTRANPNNLPRLLALRPRSPRPSALQGPRSPFPTHARNVPLQLGCPRTKYAQRHAGYGPPFLPSKWALRLLRFGLSTPTKDVYTRRDHLTTLPHTIQFLACESHAYLHARVCYPLLPRNRSRRAHHARTTSHGRLIPNPDGSLLGPRNKRTTINSVHDNRNRAYASKQDRDFAVCTRYTQILHRHCDAIKQYKITALERADRVCTHSGPI
ncbi:hypothetical protein J3A83DRAFT_1968378 [Scleroderma citrinum]